MRKASRLIVGFSEREARSWKCRASSCNSVGVTESSKDLTIFEELRFSASDELGCLGGPHNQINKTSFTEMGNACTPVCIKTKSSKVTNVEGEQDPAIGRGSVCLVKTNTRIFANYDIGNVLGKGKLTTESGTYGEVRGCIHKPTNLMRAVKIIKKKSESDKYR